MLSQFNCNCNCLLELSLAIFPEIFLIRVKRGPVENENKNCVKCQKVQIVHRILPSSVPVGNCSCNWTEIALKSHVNRAEPTQPNPTRTGIVSIGCTMLPFATFIDTRGLEHCWESHRTLFRKTFHSQILAQALALQSVAITNMLHYASICNFYKHYRSGTFFGES